MATPEGTVFVRVRPITDTFRIEAQRGIAAALTWISASTASLGAVSAGAAGVASVTSALEANLSGAASAGIAAADAQTAYNRALARGGVLLGPAVSQTEQLAAATAAGAKNTQVAQAALTGLGRASAAQAVGLGALAGGILIAANTAVTAVTSFADFEQELNTFQVVAGATADQMKEVSEESKTLGRDVSLPGVSAADAAEAMTELARAGLNVRDSLDAARGVLSLAAAAQTDNATAARIAASALNAFELPGSKAAEVADLLAKGANSAQGSIVEFGQALAQSSAVARQAGLSLDDTTAILTELAQAGLIGSDAGTSLRTALVRLINPSDEVQQTLAALGVTLRDTQGNIRPEFFGELGDAVNQLPPALRDATLAAIGGQDALRALAILGREGASGLGQTREQLNAAAGAIDTASARTKGLSGDFAALGSNVETLGVQLGAFASGPVSTVVSALGDLTGALSLALDQVGDFADIDIVGGVDLGDVIGRAVTPAQLNLIDGARAGISALTGLFSDADEQAKNLAETVERSKGFGVDVGIRPEEGGAGRVSLEKAIRDQQQKALAALRELRRNVGVESRKIGEAFAETGDAAAARLSLDLLAARAKVGGQKAGQALIDGFVQGATEAERDAVSVAQQAVRDAIEAGNREIEAAIRAAKQNLTSLGADLSAQLGTLIDEGPLGQRIAALESRLSGRQDENQRRKLKQDLSDAQKDLKNARESIVTLGQITPEQQGQIDEFLQPFQEKVRDAQASLEEFNAQGVIDDLKKAAEEQKKTVTQGIADVIARFNAGKASLADVNRAIAVALRAAGIKNEYKITGAQMGAAFNLGFQQTLATIRAELAELATEAREAVPTATTADIAGARRDAARGVADARTQLAQAQKDLQDQQLAATKVTNQILRDIRDGRRSKPAAKTAGRGSGGPAEADAQAAATSSGSG